MSADNYYEVTTTQGGDGVFRFGVNMGFSSDDHDGPLPLTSRTVWFDELDAAVSWADEQYAEYGVHVIKNEAYTAYQEQRTAHARQLIVAEAAAAERARLVGQLRLLAAYRQEYVNPGDAESENAKIREMHALLTDEVSTAKLLANILETQSEEYASGWLPSWRYGDEQLGLRPF